jgi:hypothetical protein
MKVTLKFNRDLSGLGAGGLRPRRETKRAAGSAPDSGIDSDAEGSAGENNKVSRAERAAKRAKTEADGGSDMEGLDDEEMARRLHAELNAVGGRGSRLRHGSTAPAEEAKGRGGVKTYKEPSDEIEEEEEDEEEPAAKGEEDAYDPANE